MSKKNEGFDEIQVSLRLKMEEKINLLLSQQDISAKMIENLRSKLEELSNKLGNKESIAEKLQETVNALTTERDHCEVEVKSQRTLVNDLRTEFDQLCVDVTVNNQQVKEKSSELEQLQREFDLRLETSHAAVVERVHYQFHFPKDVRCR